MSLKYALMGLLAQTPRHGYDLKQSFELSFSQMRLLNAGQIYTTLARLTNDGLVNSYTVEQENAPAKKVYSLTEAGQRELLNWLEQTVDNTVEPVRSEFFVKLMVHALLIGGPTDEGRSRAMIEQQRQKFQDDLADLRRIRLHLSLVLGPGEADPRPPEEQQLSEIRILLIEGAILHLEADLQWLNLMEAHFNRLLAQRRKPKAEPAEPAVTLPN